MTYDRRWREGAKNAIAFAITCLLFPALLDVSMGRVGSEGRIRVFCFGDVIEQYGSFNSYVVIGIDPAIETTLVPTRPGYLGGRENALRNLRIYMPRAYANLVDDYDLILSSDADSTVFRIDWINWMAKGVGEGLGIEWLGSIGRPPQQEHLDWSHTPVAELLPALTSDQYYKYGSFRVKIKDQGESLMKALPWESAPPLANLDMQIARQGAREWASVDGPKEWPLMTYWKVGSGAALCFASKFPNGVMPWSRGWPLFPQAMIYISYRVSGKDLPSDPAVFQNLMSSFLEYEGRESVVMSLVSFVERFGGNVNDLYRAMDGVEEIKGASEKAYLRSDYEGAMQLLEQAITGQKDVMARALRSRDTALFWVYLTEWLVLAATFLMTGSLLWSLMVRKRAYREVGVSKLTYQPSKGSE